MLSRTRAARSPRLTISSGRRVYKTFRVHASPKISQVWSDFYNAKLMKCLIGQAFLRLPLQQLISIRKLATELSSLLSQYTYDFLGESNAERPALSRMPALSSKRMPRLGKQCAIFSTTIPDPKNCSLLNHMLCQAAMYTLSCILTAHAA